MKWKSQMLSFAAVTARCFVVPGPARADGVKGVVTYGGSDRLARLEAGAKKDGMVLMYATGTRRGSASCRRAISGRPVSVVISSSR